MRRDNPGSPPCGVECRDGRRSIVRAPCAIRLTSYGGNARYVELSVQHERARGVDGVARCRGDARRQPWIEHQIYNLLAHAERDDTGREGSVVNLTRDGKKRVWQVDRDTAKGDFRRERVLVRVRAEYVGIARLANGLKNPQPRGIGVLENHIDAAGQLRECLFFARTDVIPISDVAGDHLCAGVHAMNAVGKCVEALSNRWQLGTTDYTHTIRASHRASDHPGEIRRLGESEYHSRDVRAAGVA